MLTLAPLAVLGPQLLPFLARRRWLIGMARVHMVICIMDEFFVACLGRKL